MFCPGQLSRSPAHLCSTTSRSVCRARNVEWPRTREPWCDLMGTGGPEGGLSAQPTTPPSRTPPQSRLRAGRLSPGPQVNFYIERHWFSNI